MKTDPPNNTLRTRFLTSLQQANPLLGVFLGTILVILLFWQIVPFSENSEGSDYSAFYRPVAGNLLAGNGYTKNGTTIALRFPPGFPLLLAGVFKVASGLSLSDRVCLALFQLLCCGFSAVLFFALARSLWERRPALLAVACWVSYPPLLWLTTQPASEIPFLVFFLATLCFFWLSIQRHDYTWKRHFLAGLCSGLGLLIRPLGIVISISLIVSIWLLLRSRPLRLRLFLSLVIGLGTLTALLPWQSFVYLRTGRLIFLSTSFVSSVRDGLRFAVNLKSYRQEILVPEDVRALMERINARFEETHKLPQLVSVVAAEARGHPFAMFKLFIIKAARSWYATDSGRREGILLLMQLVYLGLALWGVIRSFHLGSDHQRLLLIIGVCILSCWGLTTLVLSILRYMTPVIGLLFLFLPGIWSARKGITSSAPVAGNSISPISTNP